MKKKRLYYNEYRPWEAGFKEANRYGTKNPPLLVEPIKRWNVFVGDRVEILVGKDAGKHGIVNSIIKERNWVFVEGLNCEYKMIDQHPGSMPTCMRNEKPLLVTTQVKLVDPSDGKPADTEWRFTEKGTEVRVSVRTGRIIPLPDGYEAGDDLVIPAKYLEGDKDTTDKELKEVTFTPQLVTFEKDIMERMGIKEDREHAKTYWY